MPDVNTRERLIEIVRDSFGEEYAERYAAGEALFMAHGKGVWSDDKLDSLDRVEFIMAVEDAFDIEIPETIDKGFVSIDDMTRYVESMVAGPAHGAH